MAGGAELRTGPRRAVEQAFRADRGKIISLLASDFRDIDLAEEALQEAISEALRAWPERGVPDNPSGWIVTTARRRAIDRIRRGVRAREAYAEAGREWERHAPDEPGLDSAFEDEPIPDERLRLIFTCCHPALARRDAVALTLRVVAGLSSREIADAFMVKEATMQARLTRAKAKIRKAAIPFRVPEDHELPDRIDAVGAVVLLIYRAGYTPAELAPVDALRAEALRLAGVLSSRMPDEPEALGLEALLCFHEARAPSRMVEGELVPLEDQDRAGWDDKLAARADGLLERAARLRRPGPLQLQAAISGLHTTAPEAEATDWGQIAALYDSLVEMAPSPAFRVARAVAIGMAVSPTAGLAELPGDGGELAGYHRLHAARADLLFRAGRTGEARAAYRRARELATNPAEAAWLLSRERRLEDAGPPATA